MTSDSPCNCVMADLSRVNCLTSTVAESFCVERYRAEPLLAIWNLKCWSLHKSLTIPSGEGSRWVRLGESMSSSAAAWNNSPSTYFLKPSPMLAFVALILWSTLALAQSDSQPAKSPLNIRATHVLGFEGAKSNANGTLSIQETTLQFQKSGKQAVQIQIASLQGICLGQQSKQVGGLPMTLGKAATPYGGGRVISLFAHKKYETLTLEYVDSDGGFHGAMFQLHQGQGEILKDALVAKGAHVGDVQDQPKQQTPAEVPNESK